MNILVLCINNSARSIILEALLNRLGKGRITAFSAGSNPSGGVHPQALVLLSRLGYSVAHLRSKGSVEFTLPDAPPLDIVLTLSGTSGTEACPIWPHGSLCVQWGVDDPAATAKDHWEQAFQITYDILYARAKAFTALPFETMASDELKTELARIGSLS